MPNHSNDILTGPEATPGALRDLDQKEVHRLALLASLAEKLSRAGTVDGVLENVVTTLVSTFSAERGKLHLYGGQELSFPKPESPGAPSFAHSQTVVDGACQSGSAVLSFDAIEDVSLAGSQSLQVQGIRSVVCCPLVGMNASLGWLYLDSRTTTGVFSTNDLELVKVVAGVLAAAIERSRSMAQTQEKSRRLQVALKELERANRAKSEFMLTMSHELLTPLAAVTGFSQLLKRENLGPPLSPQQYDFVDQILASSKQLSLMLSDVIALTQLETGGFGLQRQNCQVDELVRSVVDSLRSRAEDKQIELKVALAPPPLLWNVDPKRFQDVARHLLDNAIKFSPRGGTVKVALGIVQNTLQLQIEDEGIGIPPRDQSRIFERFHQGDSTSTRSFGGLGLGLALVRHLVERHGGHVSVTSSGVQGEGAMFRVVLS